MEATNGSVEPDIAGRIMALEQRTRGLHGRLCALEMRFSSGESAADPTEFVPGEPPVERARLEDRLAALEVALGKKAPVQKVSMLDVTGLVVGLVMLGIGVLLATGSVDLLKNPLLAFSAGIVVLACAAGRRLLR